MLGIKFLIFDIVTIHRRHDIFSYFKIIKYADYYSLTFRIEVMAIVRINVGKINILRTPSYFCSNDNVACVKCQTTT